MMRLAFFLVLAAALLLAPAAVPAATPKGFFGVMADGPLTSGAVPFDQQIADMRGANVGSIRVAVYWSDAQPYATPADVPADQAARYPARGGVPTDLSATDAVVLAAARQGIDVLPTVLRTPAWARSGSAPSAPPRDPATYARFLTVLIERYGPKGSLWAEHPDAPRRPIRRWQVWNEPDIAKYFSPAARQSAWAAPYVRLLKPAFQAIRRADPGAKVVAAGLTNRSWADLRRIYAAGGRRWFDVAAIHPFSRRVSNVLKIVRLAREEMRKAGDRRKPLMLTELSWSSGAGQSTFNYGWEVSESGQADRVRAILPALAKLRGPYRLAGVYWYTWLSPPAGGRDSFDYGGLRRLGTDGGVVDKPALGAWRATVAKLTR
jgi:hypothetical protein